MVAIDYGREKRRWWRPPRWLIGSAGVALLAAFAWLLRVSTFSYVSVCPICGDVLYSTDWQIPFTEFTYYTVSD